MTTAHDGGNAVRIADYPRVYVTHRVFAEIGKGKGLQVVKGGLLHVPSQNHLHLAAAVGGNHIHDDLYQKEGKIQPRKTAYPVCALFRDKMVDRVALEERQEYIEKAYGHVGQDHRHKDSSVRPDVDCQPRKTEEGQMHRFGSCLFL